MAQSVLSLKEPDVIANVIKCFSMERAASGDYKESFDSFVGGLQKNLGINSECEIRDVPPEQTPLFQYFLDMLQTFAKSFICMPNREGN